jgi:hypothetical protein
MDSYDSVFEESLQLLIKKGLNSSETTLEERLLNEYVFGWDHSRKKSKQKTNRTIILAQGFIHGCSNLIFPSIYNWKTFHVQPITLIDTLHYSIEL